MERAAAVSDARARLRLLQARVRPGLDPGEKVAIIPPSIDPFSPKNQYLDEDTVAGILARIGVLDGGTPAEPATYLGRDGSPGL